MPIVALEDGREVEFPNGMPVLAMERAIRDFLATEKGQPAPSAGPSWGDVGRTVDNTVRGIARGATLGFADEFAAGMRSLGGTPYREALAQERQRDAAFDKESPVLSGAAQLAGGVMSPFNRLLPGVRGQSMAGTVGRSATTGAALGGVAGLGEGQGDDTAMSGLRGAATGAAFGAALPMAIAGGARLGARVGEATGLTAPDTVARRLVLRDLERDGVTPQQLAERAQQGGKPEMLADLAGENVLQSAQVVARSPGAGRQIAADNLRGRVGEPQAERLAGDVRQFVSGRDFRSDTQEILAARRNAAQGAYDEAWQLRVPQRLQEQVDPIIASPRGQEALRRGIEVLEEEGRAAYLNTVRLRQPDESLLFDPARLGLVRAEDGGWMLEGRTPNLRLLDAVKRGFDRILDDHRDDFGRLHLNEYTRAINGTRHEFVSLLRDRFPAYRQALDAWAGPSEDLRKLNLGRMVLNMPADKADEAIETFRSWSPQERELARIGLGREMLARISNSGDGQEQTRLNRIFMNGEIRRRTRALFDSDEDFRAFASQLEREANIARTNRTIAPNGGSPTMPMQERAADLRQPPSGPIGNSLVDDGGSPRESLLDAVVNRGGGLNSTPLVMAQRARMASRENAYRRNTEQMAPMLFSTDPAERARYAQQLLEQALADQRRPALLAPAFQGLLRGGATGAGLLSN